MDRGSHGICAWISGGAGGLGKEFAKALLRRGARGVAIVDIVDETIGNLEAANLRLYATHSPCTVLYIRCDVTDTATVERSMVEARHAFGGLLDCVINNAGIAAEGDVSKHLAVNLQSVILCTQVAMRLMGGLSRSATVVNIASAAGVYPMPSGPVYTAAKAGVVGFSRAVAPAALEVGVRVNALCPGFTATAFLPDVKNGGESVRRSIRELGVMKPATVADVLVGIVMDDSITGEAVYVSDSTGVFYPFRGENAMEPFRKARRRKREDTKRRDRARPKL
jgi:15-hydroxyprostaglandin dehydrogenase (NAD)